GKATPGFYAGKGQERPKSAPIVYAGKGVGTMPQAPADDRPPPVRFRWHAAVIGLLLIASFGAYSNSFQSGWTLDNLYIIKYDPRTKAQTWDDSANQPGIKEIFLQDYWWPKGISGLFRPITTFTYWANWSLERSGVKTGHSWIDAPLNGFFHMFNRMVADGK